MNYRFKKRKKNQKERKRNVVYGFNEEQINKLIGFISDLTVPNLQRVWIPREHFILQ